MSLGSENRPLRVAIVGSGPSGFYAADSLLKSECVVDVDMFERLPVPFGLVRFGVAPDHLKIKNVTRVYDRTAQNERFSYFGNVAIGSDLTIPELREHYDAIVLAVGAASDRSLGIPGEDLVGSHAATEFVAWYNGHPDYRDCQFDLSGETAVVIGQGNVAIDVARILAKTVDELRESDIANHALEALAESKIKTIYLVGRRGPAQAAFTSAEIKEMGELADCDLRVSPADMTLSDASLTELEMSGNAGKKKNVTILTAYSQSPSENRGRVVDIRFFQSPVEITGEDRVEEIVLGTNTLTGDAGAQRASDSGERETLACGLVFRSVGYRGVAMDHVPFHEAWGVFPHENGRVMEGDAPAPGLYATGWIKRGPSGVIGTNKADSVETVGTLLGDLASLTPCSRPDSGAVRELLAERGVRVVTYEDWGKIDAAEIARGEKQGRCRDKLVTVDEMLTFLG